MVIVTAMEMMVMAVKSVATTLMANDGNSKGGNGNDGGQ